MKINAREKSYSNDEQALGFINHIKANETTLQLVTSNIYYDFPVFKDFDGQLLITELLIISKKHGIFLVNFDEDLLKSHEKLDQFQQLQSIVFSRLLRNKSLRKSTTELKFSLTPLIFNTNFEQGTNNEEIVCISNFGSLEKFLNENIIEEIDAEIYKELVSTLEGSRVLNLPKFRNIESIENKKKGFVANEIEKEISSFDEFQKKSYVNEIIGPERIRGLAGSGKTVVLALKAAITHLRNPNATIVYTFYTKSLYQHIQRLITRFYRQYDDKDPDWEKLKIIHAWGSSTNNGVYYEACNKNKISFLTFSDASFRNKGNPFNYACSNALENEIFPIYDYIFIDEGQDFPESFIKLCLALCRGGKIVWAYDELQTIFQAKTPSIESILKDSEYLGLVEDIILYKCYRNPREILVTAHAVGFGIYDEIVQMLDEKEYWEDIGYKVIRGDFVKGDEMVIERPLENSLETISKYFAKEEIISAKSFKEYGQEIHNCCDSIKKDIENGLLPEDILVIVVDDRNAKKYLSDIHKVLAGYDIKCNNIHADKFAIKDFSMNDRVTLSTVHKAKGNEAYSVYVLGIDALYSLNPTIKERNIMFTAITRSKAWVNISGVGESATKWVSEINQAISKAPNIEFTYTDEIKKLLKRDIKEVSERKSKQGKILDDLLREMSPEEIRQFLAQREIKKN